jgi:thiol-disulfide isomerase/thioredoxin
MSGLRFFLLVMGACLAFILGAAGVIYFMRGRNSVAASGLPPVVAEVNGEKITREDLLKLVGVNRAMYPLSQGRELNMDPAAQRQFELQLLDQMIDNALIAQEAAKAGISVSDQEVDAELAALVANYNITQAQLEAQLRRAGVSIEVLREWLRGALAANQFLGQLVSEANAAGETFDLEAWLNDLRLNADVKIYLTEGEGATAARVGEPAPDFSLEDLEGRTWTLRQLKGRPIMINFWATWCKPCRVEMPLMQQAYEKYQDQDFLILAVNIRTDRGRDAVESFVEELGLTFPILLDSAGQVEDSYRVRAYPTSFFINRDGVIIDIKRGGIKTEEEMERYLKDILGEAIVRQQSE